MDPQDENLRSASPGKASPGNVSSCEFTENRIHDLMDLRRPLLSDELVREHIANCDQCAELVIDFGALNESLTQIPIETLHRLSGLKVVPEERKRNLHPISFVASVACLLLVCLTSGIWFAPSSADPAPSRIELVSTPLPPVSIDPEVDALQQLAIASPFHMTTPSTEFINAVSFEQISGRVQPFQNYLDMSADLPGIQPLSKSVNATLFLIRSMADNPSARRLAPKSKGKEPENGPDVGYHDSFAIELCCV